MPSTIAVTEPRQSSVPTPVVGMALFIAAELMFFSGLISAFSVLRAGTPGGWPPLGQPRLPLGLTAVNTLVLLASGALVIAARTALRKRGSRRAAALLSGGAGLGTLFLLIQGYEWVRLIGFGLTVSSSTYGGAFYALIGAHGVHVAAGLVALAITALRAWAGRYRPESHVGLSLCLMYWTFVVGLWPVLYGLVYLK